jgi:hypothetical protein
MIRVLLALLAACAFAMEAGAQAYKNMGYDPERDFVAISRIASGPTLICVRADSPIKDAAPSPSPAAFEREVKEETPHWEKLVRESGAKVE